MKILYISNKPPYPISDGGTMAMANFMENLLHQNIKVKHLSISTPKHLYNEDAYPKDIRDRTNPEGIFIDTSITPRSAFISLLKNESYNVARFHSKAMEKKIQSVLRENSFDAVVLDSLFTTSYIDTIRSSFKGKIILRSHNVEHHIWENFASNNSPGLKKWYLKKLAKDLGIYEKETLDKIDGLLTISEEDRIHFNKIHPNLKSKTITVSLSHSDSTPSKYNMNAIFHVGSKNWKPNEEAVNRVVHLLSDLKKIVPELTFHIAGKGWLSEYSNRESEGIIAHDFVKDLESFSRTKGILLTPIISGSGIRIKILEAMAVGVPVITTTKGAQGIEVNKSKCLLLADTNSEIVDAFKKLVNDPEMVKEIGSNAIDYIAKNHNIETISKELVEFIRSA